MTCERCGAIDQTVLVDGWCTKCPCFRRCCKCRTGVYVSKPTPNWMNRFVCDRCKHQRSR
jgi:hypothetical protein